MPSADTTCGTACNEIDDEPVIHRIVSAAGTTIPVGVTAAPRGVFDLACRPLQILLETAAALSSAARRPTGGDFGSTIITRSPGFVRVQRIRYEDTAEWREREATRRAQQRPPRPTRQARTKSRKLRSLLDAGLAEVFD